MMQLPTELWLMILDIVIEEGIIRVDHCDHTKFPYIQSILSDSHLRYHAYDSYYRLRLVCRRFKAILGDPPSQILSPSSIFPLSAAIRVVTFDLYAWPMTDFQFLSAETLSCRRLIYLDVACGLTTSSYRPNLSDFLNACEGRAFHNIRRLALRIVNDVYVSNEKNFWVRLHDAFPLLVTLVITREHQGGEYVFLQAADTVASFEWLEILYLGHAIRYDGCRFPRLRHASIWSCSRNEAEILQISPHLESLLIHSPYNYQFNVSSCSRLKLLGIREALRNKVVPPEGDCPLEHLWLFYSEKAGDYLFILELLQRLPRISRVTIDLSDLIDKQSRMRIIQGIDFASAGMYMRPPVHGDSLLIIERSPHQLGI